MVNYIIRSRIMRLLIIPSHKRILKKKSLLSQEEGKKFFKFLFSRYRLSKFFSNYDYNDHYEFSFLSYAERVVNRALCIDFIFESINEDSTVEEWIGVIYRGTLYISALEKRELIIDDIKVIYEFYNGNILSYLYYIICQIYIYYISPLKSIYRKGKLWNDYLKEIESDI